MRRHPSTLSAPIAFLGCALVVYAILCLAGYGLYTLIRNW